MNAKMWNRAAIAIAVAVLAVGAPWFAHQIKNLPASSLERRSAQRIVTLDVAGMTCDRCESAVRGQLAEVPGVSTVEVRYRERRAFVVCGPSVTDTALTAAVHRAGQGFLAEVAAQ